MKEKLFTCPDKSEKMRGKTVESRVARWLIFKPKNSSLGKFWRALDLKMLIYFVYFGIFYDHWVLFVFIWYISVGFGTMYHEKSGNPGWDQCDQKCCGK
jgi:hypothetical protein